VSGADPALLPGQPLHGGLVIIGHRLAIESAVFIAALDLALRTV